MNQLDSIINLSGFSDIAIAFLNKLSDAIGWLATHETLQHKGISVFVSEIEKSDLNPFMKAACISQAKKLIKEYSNQRDIIGIAMQLLDSEAKPNAVDNDWISQFADRVRLVSDEDFQILWAGILASECNTPGSMPKSLLGILEQMDKPMADTFMKIASCSVWYNENGRRRYAPLIFLPLNNNDLCNKLGICYDDLIDLESVGLIKISNSLKKSSYSRKYAGVIHYFDKEVRINPWGGEMEIGNVEYSKAGEALCAAVKPDEICGFLTDHIMKLMAGVTSMIVPWTPED